MNNKKEILSNLYTASSQRNFEKLKSLFEQNKFEQKEIDNAFRICIHNYNKNSKESYVKCIRLFLKKTTTTFYFVLEYSRLTNVIVSGEQ